MTRNRTRTGPQRQPATPAQDRPDPGIGMLTRALRASAPVVTIAAVLAVLARYPSLPETIPTHFNVAGEADDWGPKAMIFVLVGIFVPLVGALTWLSTRPQIFNYPVPVTEHNAAQLHRIGAQMMSQVSLACAVLFGGIVVTTVSGLALGPMLLVGGVGLFAAVAVGLARMLRAR